MGGGSRGSSARGAHSCRVRGPLRGGQEREPRGQIARSRARQTVGSDVDQTGRATRPTTEQVGGVRRRRDSDEGGTEGGEGRFERVCRRDPGCGGSWRRPLRRPTSTRQGRGGRGRTACARRAPSCEGHHAREVGRGLGAAATGAAVDWRRHHQRGRGAVCRRGSHAAAASGSRQARGSSARGGESDRVEPGVSG